MIGLWDMLDFCGDYIRFNKLAMEIKKGGPAIFAIERELAEQFRYLVRIWEGGK